MLYVSKSTAGVVACVKSAGQSEGHALTGLRNAAGDEISRINVQASGDHRGLMNVCGACRV